MNDHLCTALVAASGDPGTGKAFHEFSGRIWALCKRNATSRDAIIYYRNTNIRGKLIGNRNDNKLLSTIQKLLYEQKATSNIRTLQNELKAMTL